ncbi:hypothetical protein [Winogradskya consettensis]|uniref:hypothetical protein n=1 Tax=Winogradskya consettensis TaxID=113560 RepID=UPI001BB38C56|nr:hypothetical protein [Actinoplanes consettensis]
MLSNTKAKELARSVCKNRHCTAQADKKMRATTDYVEARVVILSVVFSAELCGAAFWC